MPRIGVILDPGRVLCILCGVRGNLAVQIRFAKNLRSITRRARLIESRKLRLLGSLVLRGNKTVLIQQPRGGLLLLL